MCGEEGVISGLHNRLHQAELRVLEDDVDWMLERVEIVVRDGSADQDAPNRVCDGSADQDASIISANSAFCSEAEM